ncbi:hypothetical protein BUE80_DR011035 [Diplocarpon rosae]|nr:hypothetical protein BUE80_DR011035 [Diplocarpon rosae]
MNRGGLGLGLVVGTPREQESLPAGEGITTVPTVAFWTKGRLRIDEVKYASREGWVAACRRDTLSHDTRLAFTRFFVNLPDLSSATR